MKMTTKVAVVTGSNKGIGFAIVRGLCKRFDGVVYLTSRDIERGKKAVEELNKEGLTPSYHQLDITDKNSIETFRDYIKNKYEGIDILVNNAAIAFKTNATEPVAVQAEQTLFVNYFSLVLTCEILFPLLKNGARVVNVSSSAGHLSRIPSRELRHKLKDENLTIPELSKLMQQYIDAAKEGTQAADWGKSSYVVSKVGVSALTNIQQRILNDKGLTPSYHQLDITDKNSIETFRDYIKNKYEGIDILVNNAAIAFKTNATEPVAVQAEQTLFVNYFSLVLTCEILFPLLKNGARVVNVSSSAGHLSRIPSRELRHKLKDENLTIPELSKLMQQYVDAAKEGTQAADWGNSSYVVSKVGVSALTNIQQRMLNDKDIKVNSVHPGYVDTDMTSHKGPLTIDEGAIAPLFLALDADDNVRGKYVWNNKQIVDWASNKIN